VADPYFGGRGPSAKAALCGGCMIGCRYNAKNTLVKNYLYLAERAGARSGLGRKRAGCSARHCGWQRGLRRGMAGTGRQGDFRMVTVRGVIFAGGVLGTVSVAAQAEASGPAAAVGPRRP